MSMKRKAPVFETKAEPEDFSDFVESAIFFDECGEVKDVLRVDKSGKEYKVKVFSASGFTVEGLEINVVAWGANAPRVECFFK